MMTRKVYCKDCVWLDRQQFRVPVENLCKKDKLCHPVFGEYNSAWNRPEIIYADCMVKNATCTCPHHTPKDGGKRE